MFRAWIFLAAGVLALPLPGCALFPGLNTNQNGSGTPTTGKITTIVLVRHAERNPDTLQVPDPPLNEEGQRRALALRDVLIENGVDVIYCTDLLRNRQSVEPIATALGITPNLVNPARYVDTGGAAREIVNEILNLHAGKTVLFCGNRGSVLNTPGITNSIYRVLGGTGDPPDRYQDLYIAIVPPEGEGTAKFLKPGYGGESSLD